MQDQYTTTTKNSYGNRLGSSLKGVLIGLLIIIGAIVMIFINERNQAQKVRLLKNVTDSVISIEPVIDAQYQNEIVHTTGLVTSTAEITDAQFALVFDDVLKYRRNVEMYQWEETQKEETKDKLGGSQEITVTTTYDKVWSAQPIDSGEFLRKDYINPTDFPLASLNQQVDQATINDSLAISTTLINRIGGFEGYVPEGTYADYQSAGGGAYLYQGKDYNQPKVGDIRVSFSTIPEGTYSFIGSYDQGIIAEYTGKKQSLGLVTKGSVTADEMITQEKGRTRTIGWILRGAAFLLMFMGLSMVFGPLEALASVVPMAGRFVGAVSKFLIFFIALIFSLVTASIAWVLYRPVIGGLLIAGTLGITFLVWKVFKKKEAAGTTEQKGV